MDLESRVTGIVGRGNEKGEIIFELEPEGRPKVPQGRKPNQFHPCGCPSNYVSELLPTLAS
jgi:hypothetical protein